MSIDQKFIDDLLLRIQAGEEVERDKFELKTKWYDLDTPKGCQELCKDISAIANTTSYDEGLLIIGVDKSKGKLINSPFASSGIDDASKLRGIVVKRVDRPPDYSLEEITVLDEKGKAKILSIISIPPSFNKPHVLKNYNNVQNYIPIRKGTSINSASRDDLEIMFYDRTKIEPPNRLEVSIYRPNLVFRRVENGSIHYILAYVDVLLDNSGRRPASIIKSKLTLSFDTDHEIIEQFEGSSWEINNAMDPIGEQRAQFPTPILLGPNKTLTCSLVFRFKIGASDEKIATNLLNQYKALESYSFKISVETITQDEFFSDNLYYSNQ